MHNPLLHNTQGVAGVSLEGREERTMQSTVLRVVRESSTVHRTEHSQLDLSRLLVFPPEIFLEVTSYFYPPDLLHFLEAVVLPSSHRPSDVDWRQVRSNVPGLPPPPEDMSEEQYALVMFSGACFRCKRGDVVVHTVWSIRMRLCTECRFKVFLPIEHLRKKLPPKVVLVLPKAFTPNPNYPRLSRRRHIEYISYHGPTYLKWKEEYLAAENQDQWVANKITERQQIIKNVSIYDKWLKTAPDDLRELDRRARVDQIIHHMRDCGWADEIERMNDENMKRLRRRQDIVQASRSPVTSEVYASLEITLNQPLLKIQEERLNRERRVFLKRSFVVQEAAVRIYSAGLPGNSIFPTVADVYFHPRVQEIFNNAASTDVFTIDTFPGIQQMAKDCRIDADNKLREMVLEAVPSIKSPSHCDLLNLAVIAFKCSACWECFGPRTYPRVLMHKCARMAEESMFHGDAAEMLLTNKYCCVPWNINGHISFDLRAYPIIEKTLIDCGLSLDITTRSDMDKQRHVFRCMPCSNARQGLAVMTWDMMVVHLMSTRHDFELDLSHIRRISERESVHFTSKIQERYDRWHTDPFSLALVCIRCKSFGNLLSLESHLPANVPADHDNSPVCHVVPVLDSMTAPPICWAQPEQDMGTPCLD